MRLSIRRKRQSPGTRFLPFRWPRAFWWRWNIHRWNIRWYQPSVGGYSWIRSLTGYPSLWCQECCHVSVLHWICTKLQSSAGWYRCNSVLVRWDMPHYCPTAANNVQIISRETSINIRYSYLYSRKPVCRTSRRVYAKLSHPPSFTLLTTAVG